MYKERKMIAPLNTFTLNLLGSGKIENLFSNSI